jgi:hypothetical protein
MKPMIAMRLLAPLAFVVAAAVPVRAQEMARQFTRWNCEIDLTFPNGVYPNPNLPATVRNRIPPSVFTFNTRKQCPGNTQSGVNENITIECKALIPGWAGRASTNKPVPCQINGDLCGVPGSFPATKSSLNIDSAGNARLSCSVKPK